MKRLAAISVLMATAWAWTGVATAQTGQTRGGALESPVETGAGAGGDAGPPAQHAARARPGALAADNWSSFSLDGVHPFVGFALLGGPVVFGEDGGEGFELSDPQPSALFALRGGVILDGHELALEVSPMTFVWSEEAPGPAFQLNASYGYLIELYSGDVASVYWPLRLGAGFTTGNTEDSVFFQMRADLVGLMLQMENVTLDIHVPSFRWNLWPSSNGSGDDTHLFYWSFGVGLGYVF